MVNPNQTFDQSSSLPEVMEQHEPLNALMFHLQDNGVNVSTPEWLNFLGVVEQLGQSPDVSSGKFYQTLKAIAASTLVKHRSDLATFSEVFDDFFGIAEMGSAEAHATIQDRTKLQQVGQEILSTVQDKPDEILDQNQSLESDEYPDLKESLGIQEVAENLQLDGEHDDNENIHGGDKDQHNDILQQADVNKIGGGEQHNNNDSNHPGVGGDNSSNAGNGAENINGDVGATYQTGTGHAFGAEAQERSDEGIIGHSGGKGKYDHATMQHEPETSQPIMYTPAHPAFSISENTRNDNSQNRYQTYPNSHNVRTIVERLHKIIEDTTELRERKVDINSTVNDFARKNFRITYEKDREVDPKIVLLIDVGGPVDTWRPMMEELAKGMSSGLAQLETYCFHNQLYGYCWKPTSDNYAPPNGLINIKNVVNRDKKVIIYGDADMAYDEVYEDFYPPSHNAERLDMYTMNGIDCLRYIRQHSDGVVWVNPMLDAMEVRDTTGALVSGAGETSGDYETLHEIAAEIPMFGLSVGGVEDAVRELMRNEPV